MPTARLKKAVSPKIRLQNSSPAHLYLKEQSVHMVIRFSVHSGHSHLRAPEVCLFPQACSNIKF